MKARILAEKEAVQQKLAGAKAVAAQDAPMEDGQPTKDGGATVKPEATADTQPVSEQKDAADVDVFGVNDINNVFDSPTDQLAEPLYAHFSQEDWALVNLRVELHLLAIAFRKDVVDPERVGVHRDLLDTYYQKFSGHPLTSKLNQTPGALEALFEQISDTLFFDPSTSVLRTLIWEDVELFDIFVKITEVSRRDRVLQQCLGEALKARDFLKLPQTQDNRGHQGQHQKGGYQKAERRDSQHKGQHGHNNNRSAPYQQGGSNAKWTPPQQASGLRIAQAGKGTQQPLQQNKGKGSGKSNDKGKGKAGKDQPHQSGKIQPQHPGKILAGKATR